MARMAARVDDLHICPLMTPTVHFGGLVLAPGAPNTLVNGKHAARVGDKAHCNAPAPDTVRGGLITVFIDGSPASRIVDKTDVGLVVMGSPNVLLGEWGGGPLTPFQAQWLYDHMASQNQIPFEYATDGCFARADRMAEHMKALGIDVRKQWVRSTTASGSLHVPIANYPGGGVTWGWHVAPVVDVLQPGGGSQPMVIDPSLGFTGPVGVDDWIGKQSTNPGATVTGSTSPDVYFRGWDRVNETWDSSRDVMRDPKDTAQHLEDYRNERANLPASSGRNIPNAPVHY